MGYLFKNVCFSSVTDAKQAACSGASAVWGSGSSVYTLECATSTFDTTSMTLCRRTDGGACETFAQDYPTFSPCDFEAGTALGIDWMWAAFLLFVVLFAAKRLIAIFSGSDDN